MLSGDADANENLQSNQIDQCFIKKDPVLHKIDPQLG